MYEVAIYHQISSLIARNENSYSYNNMMMIDCDVHTDEEICHYFLRNHVNVHNLPSLISHNIVNKKSQHE